MGHTVRIRCTALVALVAGAVLIASGSAAAAPAAVGASPGAPLIRIRASVQRPGTTSTNWSGYGIGGTFGSVAGSWTVPVVSPSPSSTYSSTWIGIDGLANKSLIQTGTESDSVGGHVVYDAWWEVLPAAEKVIVTLPVSPGDRMSATITQLTGHKWTIVLSDLTSGHSFSHTRAYRGPATSAEWIEERPQLGRTLSTLAPFATTTFSGIRANGADPNLTPASAISMVSTTGTQVLASPSTPSSLGDAFSVAYGPTAPPAPAG